MTIYIVSFEVGSADRITKVRSQLKSYGRYCPINAACWAIGTDKSAVQVRDELLPLLDAADRLFVIRSGTEAAWYNSYGEKNDEWLKKNL